MDKKKKMLIIIAGAALAFTGIAYFMYTRGTLNGIMNQLKALTGSKTDEPAENTNGGTTPQANTGFPLQVGSKGASVVALQKLLISKGQSITADGSFGPLTQAALQKAFNRSSISSQSELDSLAGSTPNQATGSKTTEELTKLASEVLSVMLNLFATFTTTMRTGIMSLSDTDFIRFNAVYNSIAKQNNYSGVTFKSSMARYGDIAARIKALGIN